MSKSSSSLGDEQDPGGVSDRVTPLRKNASESDLPSLGNRDRSFTSPSAPARESDDNLAASSTSLGGASPHNSFSGSARPVVTPANNETNDAPSPTMGDSARSHTEASQPHASPHSSRSHGAHGSSRSSRRRRSFQDRRALIQQEIKSTLFTYTDQWTGELHESVGVLHPYTRVRIYWDVGLLCVLIYDMISTPLIVGFEIQLEGFPLLLDIACTVFFALDIALNFCTGYIVGTVVVLKRRQIITNYLRGFFFIDLISALPWEMVVVGVSRHIRLLRLVRVLRLFRAKRILQRVRYWVSVKFSVRSIMQFFFILLITAHWNACTWMLIASLQEFSDRSWISQGALADLNIGEKDRSTRYLVSFYWAVTTMTTVGFGDIVPYTNAERLFAMVTMVVGCATFAYGITQIVTLIANLNPSEVRFRRQMDDLHEYMEARHIPFELRVRLREFYQFKKHHSFEFLRENEILQSLPPSLRTEVMVFNNEKIALRIKDIPLFKDLDQRFLKSIVTRLRFDAYPPGELIINEGERGNRMYFLSRGKVQVQRGGVNLAVMHEGSYFGEVALYHSAGKRTATVFTLTYCEACTLKRADVDEALEPYPDVKEALQMRSNELWLDYERSSQAASLARAEGGGGRGAGAGAAPRPQLTREESWQQRQPRPHSSRRHSIGSESSVGAWSEGSGDESTLAEQSLMHEQAMGKLKEMESRFEVFTSRMATVLTKLDQLKSDKVAAAAVAGPSMGADGGQRQEGFIMVPPDAAPASSRQSFEYEAAVRQLRAGKIDHDPPPE